MIEIILPAGLFKAKQQDYRHREPFNDVLRKILLQNQTIPKTDNAIQTKSQSQIINRKIGVDAKGIELPNGKLSVFKGSKNLEKKQRQSFQEAVFF